MAAGTGARVTILDVQAERMKYLDDVLPPNCVTVHSDRSALEQCLATADLVIGAVLGRGHHRAQAGHARDAAADEATLGRRRRGRRPGRVLRDHAPDDPQRSGLLRGGHPPLRRRQHTGGLPSDLHSGLEQRHLPLRARHSEQGSGTGRSRGRGSRAGREHVARQAHLCRRGLISQRELRLAGRDTAD